MTTWNDLVGYIKKNYQVKSEEPGVIEMVFDTPDGRSQTALVMLQTIDEDPQEWVTIESPVTLAADRLENVLVGADTF